MIGMLIIAHGDLGNSFVQCASHIMGNQPPQLTHLRINAGDDPDVILSGALKLIRELDSGSGVLVLSDICGATPCNIGSRLVRKGKVECLAGVNLPMLVRALTYRHEPLAMASEKALAGGKEGVLRILPEGGNAKPEN
ncbi:MAG: PTS fructose transporter subunit IIA [Nitrosospira sp.]|nr:PTS fructose transporter subunit IIA [Nitrosospira sp.]MBN9126073.1 PTS fructose transporter subunit IIA [Nitrosospira sp.]OJY14866.1 MAG: PTS fructose transporter subunit IIA [Nitrosospira sp. 56-18]